MPRTVHNALTPLTVKNAKPGRHVDGGGLHLLVKPTGAKAWVFRYMLKGRTRDIGLGAATGPAAVSLSDARDEATRLRLQVKSGIDPLAERDREAAEAAAAEQAAAIARITFRAVAESYIAANESEWRNPKHRKQWRSTLETYAYPVLGDLPVADIGTAHVLQVLEPIWREKAETASRVRGRIETVLDAARARGYRDGDNPARWRGHIAQVLPKRGRLTRGHHPALPYVQVPRFIADLRAREGAAALALEFAILNAARTGEVLGAKRSEVDIDGAVWIIPPARMKSGKEHRVPLTPRALAIIAKLAPLGTDWLFPSSNGKALSNMALQMLMRRMHEASLARGEGGYFDPREGRPATPHGFRSAFRDWGDERTGYAWELKELALAHTIPNKSEAAYRRGDMFEKRRRLMRDWAAYCDKPANIDGNVLTLRSQAG